jgi:hypothetical protein
MRKSLRLQAECGTASGDLVVWWCCACCALCEESREMRTRKCRTTAEYLKRVQETLVAEMSEGSIMRAKMGYADKYVPEERKVEPSTLWHKAGAGYPQCSQYCCCAPDESEEEVVVTSVEFQFTESRMPHWVTYGMQAL